MASPLSITQLKINSFTTNVTDRSRWLPFVYNADLLDTFLCLPLDFLQEFTESNIRDFFTPQAFHTVKVQVLKEQPIKLAYEIQAQVSSDGLRAVSESCGVFSRDATYLSFRYLLPLTLRERLRLACLIFLAPCL